MGFVAAEPTEKVCDQATPRTFSVADGRWMCLRGKRVVSTGRWKSGMERRRVKVSLVCCKMLW